MSSTAPSPIVVAIGPVILWTWCFLITFICLFLLSQMPISSRPAKIIRLMWLILLFGCGLFAAGHLLELGSAYFVEKKLSQEIELGYFIVTFFICFLLSPWTAFGVFAVFFPKRRADFLSKLNEEYLNERGR
jgi:hypothetical protein